MKTAYTQFPINKLYKKRDRIDLDPYFQREKVWKKPRKQYFIDTLLKGWGVPKIYLLSEGSEAKKSYSCIDGKQRLLSIFEFMSDEFSTSSKYDKSIGEKFYSQLPDELSDRFDDYLVTVEEVNDAKPEEITELFKRLQLGVPLNSGENLMAVSGYLKDSIRNLSNHNFFKKKLSLSDTRYSHFVVCTQIAFLEINGITNLSIGKLEDMLKNHNDKSKVGLIIETKLKKIKSTLDSLDKVFTEKSEMLKNRATIISFYLLISELIDKTNITGKEPKVMSFFDNFSKELNKQIGLGTNATDPKMVHYQSVVTQGADKQKAIKSRQEILIQKLMEYRKDIYKLLRPELSLLDRHQSLFDQLEAKFKTQEEINNWITANGHYGAFPKCNSSRGLSTKETLPVHIRNCIHKKHGRYTNSQLLRSIDILEKSVKKI